MGITSKIVKVVPRGVAIKHYREKGYDAKHGVELEVKVEDIRRIQKKLEVITKNVPEDGYILGKVSTEQNALMEVQVRWEMVIQEMAVAEVLYISVYHKYQLKVL